MTSSEFEELVYRIQRIMGDVPGTITLDDKIPDPDNPKQLRQIDISVKNGDKTLIIECRNHVKKQDVKWIEELQGRKLSLEVDQIFGVSNSGFTEGAIKKAKRFKIGLFDLREIKDDRDIYDFFGLSQIELKIYEFRKLYIQFALDAPYLDLDVNEIAKHVKPYFVGLFAHLSIQLDNNFRDSISFEIPNFKLFGSVVKQIVCDMNVKIRYQNLALDTANIFSDRVNEEKKGRVDKFGKGTIEELVNNDGFASVKLDLDKLDIPKNCIPSSSYKMTFGNIRKSPILYHPEWKKSYQFDVLQYQIAFLRNH